MCVCLTLAGNDKAEGKAYRHMLGHIVHDFENSVDRELEHSILEGPHNRLEKATTVEPDIILH